MAELYVKPGNQERGWNDPPQFSYGLQAQAEVARRTPLTRRAPPPPRGALPGAPPEPGSAPAASAPPAPPALGPPPPGPVGPAPRAERGRPSPAACPEEECGLPADAVLAPLRETLGACRPAVQKQVCDDIGRRLTVLEDAWAHGKLSAPVRKRMRLLVEELQQQHWDVADEIHRSLMVDHVNEVSQWLVGIKHLIAEMRSLPTAELAAVTDGSAEAEPVHEDS